MEKSAVMVLVLFWLNYSKNLGQLYSFRRVFDIRLFLKIKTGSGEVEEFGNGVIVKVLIKLEAAFTVMWVVGIR